MTDFFLYTIHCLTVTWTQLLRANNRTCGGLQFKQVREMNADMDGIMQNFTCVDLVEKQDQQAHLKPHVIKPPEL